MTDSLGDFEKEPFGSGGINHDVYRRGSGPAVIVCSEVPGITPKVADFARRVSDRGMTAVMPHLFGTPGREMTPGYAAGTILKLCISKEFSGLAMGRSSPIIDWLRALARAEHKRCGGPGVGAVGMCFTGGFALAMAVDDTVLAPVLSQPSLPFGVTKARRADIQMSALQTSTRCLVLSGNLDPSPGGEHPFPPEMQWKYTQHQPFLGGEDKYATNRRSVSIRRPTPIA